MVTPARAKFLSLGIGLVLGSSIIGSVASSQIEIGLTPTPMPTATPDESYKDTNRYVDPELGWSISWPDGEGLEPLATQDGRFILRNTSANPEIYIMIVNIDSDAGARSDHDKVQSCLDDAGRFDNSEILEGPNGDPLTETNDEEGWAVFGYDSPFGPRTTYAHCWIVPGESRIVYMRAELGTPTDFNNRSHIVNELTANFRLP